MSRHATSRRRLFPAVTRRARRLTYRISGAPARYYDHVYSADAKGIYTGNDEDNPYLPVWNELLDRVRAQEVSSILEIGCGPGLLAEFLLANHTCEYVGFDFSKVAVALAQDRLGANRVHYADARSTDLVNQKVDLVLCTEVLEHVRDDLLVLSRVPTGSWVLATVPDFDSEAHLRYFASTAEVRNRYGALFHDLEIVEVKSGPRRFFILDGHRG